MNQQILGIELALRDLLPSVETVSRQLSERDFRRRYAIPYYHGQTAGRFHSDHLLLLWLRYGDLVFVIEARRDTLPFSHAEQKLLRGFERVVASLYVTHQARVTRSALRIASFHSFTELMVALYVWNRKAHTFWTPVLLINQLQELALERYEGARCTSGFVFVGDINPFLEDLDEDLYVFERFNQNVLLRTRYFSKPGSYRYVDGRNAFYVVDNQQVVHGVVRCMQPRHYDMAARVSNNHLSGMLNNTRTRTWVGYVGNNDDVNIALPNGKQLRCHKRAWHFIDRDLLVNVLREHGACEELLQSLIPTLFAVSDMRKGTVVLIPDDDAALPPEAGRIDDSPLGQQLADNVNQTNFTILARRNAAIGLLTSDGLTVVSREGKVLRCGSIIAMDAYEVSFLSGGGRTHAARAASRYGYVIKVSEDGPVSLYRNGECLLTYRF
ncbi:hypothetical protein [Rubinisphaera margarita]|uniref:hypothetical protein n=1 Tax=Rubinisphaera margarita TaxID=2909586 RepID=UPI001EE7E1C4|nr:hypothetical protein [Rubinisphaera margarita]MCG6157384.1 hypothetical protein [Rubinisphaera margarita]